MFCFTYCHNIFSGIVGSRGTRPMVLSRSTYVGSGHWAAHWLGDNSAAWNHLQSSIIGKLDDMSTTHIHNLQSL